MTRHLDIKLRLNPVERERLDMLAKTYECSVAEVVRRLAREECERLARRRGSPA